MSFINDATPGAIQFRNWNWRLGQSAAAVSPIAAGQFVVGEVDLTGGIKRSANGTAWNAVAAMPAGNSTVAVHFGAGVGFMVPSGPNVYTSTDTLNWTLRGAYGTTPGQSLQNVLAYSPALSRWVMSGTPMRYSNDNGDTWAGADSSMGATPYAVVWSAASGVFLAANLNVGPGVYRSATGLDGSWVAGSFPADREPCSFIVTPLAIFMGCLNNTPGSEGVTICKSVDGGATFSTVYNFNAGGPQLPDSGACSDDGQFLVMNSALQGSVRYFYSTDFGATWTDVVSGVARFTGITFYNGLFYLSRRTGEIYTSPTGAVLTLVSTVLPSVDWDGIAVST